MRLFAFLLLSSVALQAESWPLSVRVISGPCWKVIDTSEGKKRYAAVQGTIDTDDDRWLDMTISGHVIVKDAGGKITEYHPKGKFYDIRTGIPGKFEFGIDRAALEIGDEVLKCEPSFVEGTRITGRPSSVSLVETPLAKDEGCLRDLADALHTEGLAGRKKLAELVQYRCVEIAPANYAALSVKAVSIKASTPTGHPTSAISVTLKRPYGADQSLKELYSGFTLPTFIGSGKTAVVERLPAVDRF